MTAHESIPTLAGVLSGFALADVLQLLELGARTGDLVVDGGSRGRGAVRLRVGRVVSVTDGARPITTAAEQIASITRMLDWSAGRWTFRARDESTMSANAADDGLAITAILVDAARCHDDHDRRSTRAAVPSADIPDFAEGDDADRAATGACLTAVDLHILAAVDGVRDVSAIAVLTRCGVTQVAGAVERLRALGVLRARTAGVSAGSAGALAA